MFILLKKKSVTCLSYPKCSCIPCGHVYGRSCLERWLHHCNGSSAKVPCVILYEKKSCLICFIYSNICSWDFLDFFMHVHHSLQCPQCGEPFALKHIINLYGPGNLWDGCCPTQVCLVPPVYVVLLEFRSILLFSLRHTWNWSTFKLHAHTYFNKIYFPSNEIRAWYVSRKKTYVLYGLFIQVTSVSDQYLREIS